MPIRLKCSCGKALAVNDGLAGKAVKCPGCQQTLKIPASPTPASKPNAATAATAKALPAAAANSGAKSSSASVGSLGDLFDEEGLGQTIGPICPACGKPLKRANSVLCTHCGVNLETGQKVMGHSQTIANKPTLGHAELDAAVVSMKKDVELQKRTTNVGMPWWFLLIMLSFVGGFGFALVTIVNAANADEETTGLAKILKDYAANKNIVYGCIITGIVIQTIARIWIIVLGFMKEFGEGIVAMFLYHKYLGLLFERPIIALVYTMGVFTTLSGFGLWIVNWLTSG